MKQPFLRDDAFLADVAAVRSGPPPSALASPLSVWWLGQSGFLAHWNGRCVLFDPYLSDSLTRKYAATDKPHVRMTCRVVAPERLDFVDLVTSSHNHTDHLDPETLQPLVRVNPRLVMVCPEANRTTVRERSGLPDERIVGLDHAFGRTAPGGGPPVADSMQLGEIEVRAVPAAHESLERDTAGRLIYLGFVVRMGPFTIYHSGDTIGFEGMMELLREFRPDLALLPINGRGPERRVAGNLWGREAAALAHDIGARHVVPCHYDMFEFNTATPEEFVATCDRLGQSRVVLNQGERLTLPPPGEANGNEPPRRIACPQRPNEGHAGC